LRSSPRWRFPSTRSTRGHPFRIRYEVPLILGGAACIGAAVSLLRFAAPLAAIPLLVGVVLQASPFDRKAPMIVEAQLDQNVIGRRIVTECLKRSYDGTTIMASMGSLAHYMQELSLSGFDLDDFIHEGSGPIWQQAFYFEPSLFADGCWSRKPPKAATCSIRSRNRGRASSPHTIGFAKAEMLRSTRDGRSQDLKTSSPQDRRIASNSS
jgi:hypothetical protein